MAGQGPKAIALPIVNLKILPLIVLEVSTEIHLDDFFKILPKLISEIVVNNA